MAAAALLAFYLYLRQSTRLKLAGEQQQAALQQERDLLESQVRERTASLAQLATHLQQVREEERILTALVLEKPTGLTAESVARKPFTLGAYLLLGKGEESTGDSSSELILTARVVKPATDDEDDEDHFIPPPPPPLPKPDAMTRFAWVALLGGPLYLVASVFLNRAVPSWAAFVAVAAFIGGFVALVLRMGDEPPEDDDGAVV